MVSIDTLIKIVQLKIHNVDPNYENVIKETILMIWGLIVEYHPWWFMESPTPYKFTTASGTQLYKLNKQIIGKMLYIADVNGLPLWDYREKRYFNKLMAGIETIENSNPRIFTNEGIVQRKIQIRVYPVPNSSVDAYLHYNEVGNAQNINKLSYVGIKTLLHGVFSLIAPPQEYKTIGEQLRWKALTYKEDDMFKNWLGKMIASQQPHINTDPQFQIDPDLADAIQEANTILE